MFASIGIVVWLTGSCLSCSSLRLPSQRRSMEVYVADDRNRCWNEGDERGNAWEKDEEDVGYFYLNILRPPIAQQSI